MRDINEYIADDGSSHSSSLSNQMQVEHRLVYDADFDYESVTNVVQPLTSITMR